MTTPVPQWVIGALCAVFAATFSIGIALEGGQWSDSHPFSVNLLSSLAGFTASGIFAAIVVNRLARGRYWEAELDARTTTALETEFLLRDLVSLFEESTATRGPIEALQNIQERACREDTPGSAVRVDADVVLEIEELLAALAETSDRFSFLADPDLLYRSNRLARKGRRLKAVWRERPATGTEQADCAIVACAIEVAVAADELRSWAHSAPNRRMRQAVLDRALRSDLDE